MAMSRDQYVEALKNLMPRGAAWPRELATGFHKLFQAMAEEMFRYEGRIGTNLINEADPNTALEMLTDWERLVGIPDGVFGQVVSVNVRRGQVVFKLTARGGQSRAYFIELAASLGYDIAITEFRPFVAGRSVAGEPLYNGDWLFTWKITTADSSTDRFLAGRSTAGEPLSSSSRSILEGAILRAAPAHTIVQFEYT
jgi:uncharacterized protein YmfQ (DUF2313 family)